MLLSDKDKIYSYTVEEYEYCIVWANQKRRLMINRTIRGKQ
jgi:hypothetical protein